MRKLNISLIIIIFFFSLVTVDAKIVFSSFFESYFYIMDDNGRNLRQFTFETLSCEKPRWSPDGKHIAFFMDTDPTTSVTRNTFIMDVDGTNVRQITNYEGNDQGLAFSPDGKKLLVSSVPSRGFDMRGLNIIDINSGEILKISDNNIDDVDWSPDGKQIVFVNTHHNFNITENNIWIMNSDGTDARALIPPIEPEMTVDRGHPRWSPNGKQIIYTERDRNVIKTVTENGGVHVSVSDKGTYRYKIHNIEDGTSHTLNIPNDWIPNAVAWMNNGESVLISAYDDFEHRQDLNRVSQLYRYDIATQEITQLTDELLSKKDVDWISNTVTSVSPTGKYPLRWGQLKESRSNLE